jgi:16S rRNA (guanine527-N7)-methyltransferase
VKRGVADRLEELGSRYSLEPRAVEQLGLLLEALAAEPDPPTTVRDPLEAVDHHVADSLSGLEIEPLRNAARIADLGSGAGFPGLPLAIALSSASVALVESTRRKCDVIERLAAAAGVTNARALPVRAEELAAGEGREAYDAVTARALAPLAVLVEYAAPLLRDGGGLVAWKGARNRDEERGGEAAAEIVGLRMDEVRNVRPFEGTLDLNLYLYSKVRSTPNHFPRRPGVASKRPLA